MKYCFEALFVSEAIPMCSLCERTFSNDAAKPAK